MKLEPKEAGEDIEMDMSPMIDMVFLLLIFFIVASQIVDTKPQVAIPQAAAAAIPDDDAQNRMMISVTKDDEFFVRMQPMDDLDQLTLMIQQEAAANPELRILLRADKEVTYKTIEKIMIACAQEGLVDIIFSATEESN